MIHYCEEEILRKSIFHAVFEATKSVAERLWDLPQPAGPCRAGGGQLGDLFSLLSCLHRKLDAAIVQRRI